MGESWECNYLGFDRCASLSAGRDLGRCQPQAGLRLRSLNRPDQAIAAWDRGFVPFQVCGACAFPPSLLLCWTLIGGKDIREEKSPELTALGAIEQQVEIFSQSIDLLGQLLDICMPFLSVGEKGSAQLSQGVVKLILLLENSELERFVLLVNSKKKKKQ